VSKRRGSRLFSGQPGMLLVSEDIPGITMPAPPQADAPPLVDEEPEFDLELFRRQEDEEESEQSHDGPLRVFLGADDEVGSDADVSGGEVPVFDVSALAMPEGPADEYGEDEPLRFMDDGEDFEFDDVVQVDGVSPPSLSMGVSAEVSLDSASAWEDTPTQPGPRESAGPSTAVIRDTPPALAMPVTSSIDPLDVPDADPFEIPAAMEAAQQAQDGAAERPADVLWDDDDTGFFDVQAEKQAAGLPAEPPRLMVDTEGESRKFRAIPDKEDPPILPLLIILIGIVIMTIALWLSYASEGDAVVEPAPVVPAVIAAPAIKPAPRTEGPGQPSEVAQNKGFISVDSDKPATIYVDDRIIGITPLRMAEVSPGPHRVLAVEVETGKRKAVTADVERGSERRVRFAFQPVQ